MKTTAIALTGCFFAAVFCSAANASGYGEYGERYESAADTKDTNTRVVTMTTGMSTEDGTSMMTDHLDG